MKKSLIAFFTIIVLSGCVSTSSITPLGDGTYHITGSDKGGVFSADGQVVGVVMNKAQVFCSGMNKNAKVVKLNRVDEAAFKFESGDLIFECK